MGTRKDWSISPSYLHFWIRHCLAHSGINLLERVPLFLMSVCHTTCQAVAYPEIHSPPLNYSVPSLP